MPCQLRFQERKKLAVKKDSVDQNEKFSDSKFIKYISRDSAERFLKSSTSQRDSINITSPGIYSCYGYGVILKNDEVLVDANSPIERTEQKFYFNKATGKKITLATKPTYTYQDNGAFTLVNGVQNDKESEMRKEFLGFNGIDCEVVIDLGSTQQISNVKAHVLEVKSNRIWRPKSMQVSISTDGTTFTGMGDTDQFEPNGANGNGIMTVQQRVSTRYVKIKLENYGIIPGNNPGAGNKAGVFVDELEVN